MKTSLKLLIIATLVVLMVVVATPVVNASQIIMGGNSSNGLTIGNAVTNATNDTTNNTASTDATLKNLGIKPHDFSGFRKATTSYSVTVPNDTEKITIYAQATDSKASVTGTGSKTLKVGKNTFSVKVTAEDKKTTKTYNKYQ